jgi:inner membrane protein
MNPFRWYGVVETRSAYRRMEVNSLTSEVDSEDRASVHLKLTPTPAILAAEQSRLGRVFLDWAQYPVAETERLDEPSRGFLVRFFDLRFLYPQIRRHPLGGWVKLSRNLHVETENFGWSQMPGGNH